MSMDEVVDLLPLVDRVAREVHYTHGIEESEAYGLLALEVSEKHREYLILWREGQTGLLELRLKNIAREYARRERIKRVIESDQYFYDPEYVRLFLPFFFAQVDWDNGPAPEDASTKWTTGEARDTALDIQKAFTRLRDWQYRLIVERHLAKPSEDGGVDWDRIAEVCDRGSAHSARTGYASATRVLAEEMNTVRAERQLCHEGPGAREVVSNSQARFLLTGN